MDIIKKQGKEYIDFGNGTKIAITGYNMIIEKETGKEFGVVPMISMPDDADYRWQLNCLKSRLETPQNYEESENVQEVIEHLIEWLSDYEEQHPSIKALRAAGHYKNIEPDAELLSAS